MRELNLVSPGKFHWLDRPLPELIHDGGAIPCVLSSLAAATGDQTPASAPLFRALRCAHRARLTDPAVRIGLGAAPFAMPCAIGHECVAEVVEMGQAPNSPGPRPMTPGAALWWTLDFAGRR